tara:strand:+ start:201 stop:392 length:192 start_codon:yes stop_codon:yes gene_type:complete
MVRERLLVGLSDVPQSGMTRDAQQRFWRAAGKQKHVLGVQCFGNSVMTLTVPCGGWCSRGLTR